MKDSAEKTLDVVGKRAKAQNVPVTLLAIKDDPPYAGIIATAKKKKADLIIMASHGRRGISGLLLGSETVKVLTHSTIPVLVYR
jgi:nucleotide-binding universal stress UspA family protein